MIYNWINGQVQRLDRKCCSVVLIEHCWKQTRQRTIRDVDIIVAAVRNGRIVEKKSTFPNRLCFSYYDGKSNTTYEVIGEFKKFGIEVVTVWKRKGN